MATWTDLLGYVRGSYKISDEQDGMIKLLFEMPNMRSQLVLVTRQALMDGSEEWVQFASPVGDADKIDLRAVLEEAGTMVCGGLAIMAGRVFVVDAAPLADMNMAEFDRPLFLVTATADRLEDKFVGGDQY
jgi:hypothetical protein